MTSKGLIIYDNNGTVVTILRGIETVPSGVQGIVTDIPYNIASAQVNPQTKEVTFVLAPNTEEEVSNLQEAIIELEVRVAELEG